MLKYLFLDISWVIRDAKILYSIFKSLYYTRRINIKSNVRKMPSMVRLEIFMLRYESE